MKKGLLFASICVVVVIVLYAVWPSKMIHYLTTPATSPGDASDARLSASSNGSAPLVIRKKIPGRLQEVEASYDKSKPVVITKKIPSESPAATADKKLEIKPASDLSPIPATVAGGKEQQLSDQAPGHTSPQTDVAEKPESYVDAPQPEREALQQTKTLSAEPGSKQAAAQESTAPVVIARAGKDAGPQPPETLKDQSASAEEDRQFAPRPYSIMLASCRRLDSAQAVIKQNRSKGLYPYAVRVDLGKKGIWWRVFEGNYTSASEARGVKSRYGLSESLVTKTPYAISIGAYGSETEAAAEVQRLVRLKHSPYFLPGPQNKVRLLLGAFVSKEGARQLQEELSARGISNEVVLR